VPALASSYFLDTLPEGDSCYFVATAINAGVESVYSNEASKFISVSPVGNPTRGPVITWNEMAIAFDAFSASGAAPGVDPSWTHTPVGTPRGAVVYVISPISDPVVGVTYGGTAMTNVANVDNTVGGEWGGYRITGFFLGVSVPTGAQTVAVDAGALDVFAYAYTVTAAANTEFITSASTESLSVSDVAATLSLTGRTCFCSEMFASGEDDPASTAPLTSWTSRNEADFGTFLAGSYSFDTIGSTDVTSGLTQSSDDILMLATAISEVVAGAGVSIVPIVQNYRNMGLMQ
jgi:hypothetical protein